MQYRPLGRTGIDVSVICLGTMTFGEQNDQTEAHRQLDHAVAAGVNFIDTAELYPVPAKAETYTRTEEIIGHWLAGRSDREQLVIATKVAGPGDWVSYMRDGPMGLDRRNIRLALDASLRRLQTDYIDLYQLHWPERPSNYFGRLGYSGDGSEPLGTPIEETLEALAEQIEAGRIRHIGLSNETPWGLMRFVVAAERLGLPRVVSIQNPYSLLNRSFEVGLAECAVHEAVCLLAYSVLGFGVLSGKYLDGSAAADARLNLEMFSAFTRYSNDPGVQATHEYVALAREHGLDPAQMALAFVHSRPFVTSTIIGATTMAQLQSNLDSMKLVLTPEVLEGIEAIHQRWSNPCP
jgi:aryl-alcohol dehydrogenase-like predicted oxidoreductase